MSVTSLRNIFQVIILVINIIVTNLLLLLFAITITEIEDFVKYYMINTVKQSEIMKLYSF